MAIKMENAERKKAMDELNRKIKNLRRKIKRRENNLKEWSLSPETSQPLSSVPQIIYSLQQEIAQLLNELKKLLTEKRRLKNLKEEIKMTEQEHRIIILVPGLISELDEISEKICILVNFGLKNKIFPNQFEQGLNSYIENGIECDQQFIELLSNITPKGEDVDEYWLFLTYCSDSYGEVAYPSHQLAANIISLYEDAAKNKVERIIVVYLYPEELYFVGIIGSPGARAIEVEIIGEKNCKDDYGEWLIKWPPELGHGAAIKSLSITKISAGAATLCNGTVIEIND